MSLKTDQRDSAREREREKVKRRAMGGLSSDAVLPPPTTAYYSVCIATPVLRRRQMRPDRDI